MAPCILCVSETTVDEVLGATKCQRCDTQYIVSEAAGKELTSSPGWPVWRFELARALRWRFYIQQQPATIVGLLWAQSLVQERNDFYADAETRELLAVDALRIRAASDPWHEPILRLGRDLGLSREESRTFAEDLIIRGIARIITLETQPLEGAKSFGPYRQWERCEENKTLEQQEGTE